MPAPTGRLTVLVLGVGGNVSQGILKALAQSPSAGRVIGACIDARAAGLYLCDRAYISPPAAEPDFVSWLTETCRAEGVDAVLSGVEPVLEVLAREAAALEAETGARCVTSPPEVLAIGQDKLATSRWLAAQGLAFPATAGLHDPSGVAAVVADCSFPLIVKPRRGKGSAGVRLVGSAAELHTLAGDAALIVQEHLGDPSVEFTAGCFCDRDGALQGSVVFRRSLAAGTTDHAVAGDFPAVRAAAESIAGALRPMGPLNVQMRETDRGPVAFELNVRFSGTTPVRVHLGFNEVEAALRHLVLDEDVPAFPANVRGTMLRYWNEVYVDADAMATLKADGCLADPAAADPVVGEWGMPR